MFKLGDKVISEGLRHGGTVGTVIHIQENNTYPYLVEYDDYIDGHDGGLSDTVGKDGHCWWEDYDSIIIKDDNGMLDTICEMLGVRVGEVWLGNDGYHYHIDYSGSIEVIGNDSEVLGDGYNYWEEIFTGQLKPKWQPEKRGKYYLPNLNMGNGQRYSEEYWGGSDWEYRLYHNNLVFRTKEEAIEATYKMLNALREDSIL